MHKNSIFLTLTYRPDDLPQDRSINMDHLKKFIQDLRDYVAYHRPDDSKIRYFGVGEYGDHPDPATGPLDHLGRPHYHVILFGYFPPDWTKWRKNEYGHDIYRSEEIEERWPYGNCEFGVASKDTAAYVAAYTIKKATGDHQDETYQWQCPLTGEVFSRQPEHITYSRMPGLGASWYEKYKSDLYKGYCTIDGKRVRIPDYYMRKLENEATTTEVEAIKEVSKKTFDPDHPDHTTRRRKTISEIKHRRVKKRERDL
jgi:hypothetical protein